MYPWMIYELLIEERLRDLERIDAARIAEVQSMAAHQGQLRRTLASALMRLALSLDRSAG